jgi:hypothetical protein
MMIRNNQHTETEIEEMKKLILDSLHDYNRQMDFLDFIPDKLLVKYDRNIRSILNQAHGGSLSPEEIAEMILVKEFNPKINTEEAAATNVLH